MQGCELADLLAGLLHRSPGVRLRGGGDAPAGEQKDVGGKKSSEKEEDSNR